jgi:hypothetical protein
MSGSDPELQLPVSLPLDSHAGPAARLPRERLAAMVETALLEFDRTTPQPTDASPAPKLSPRSGSRTMTIAAGTALAIIGGAAAAHYLFSMETAKPATPKSAVEAPASPGQPPMAATPSSVLTSPAAPTDAVSDEPATHDRDDLSADGPQSRGRRTATRAGAPDDLLQKANQQRAGGDFRAAAQTYSLVYERFPRTQSAYVARVAAGALELEHLSNPTKARKLFEQALTEQPRGALDLEARQGLSTALRDLEDRSGERQALRTLITRHPGSPAARRAQVRLLELGGE